MTVKLLTMESQKEAKKSQGSQALSFSRASKGPQKRPVWLSGTWVTSIRLRVPDLHLPVICLCI